MEHCFRRESSSPKREGRELEKIWPIVDPLTHISEMAEARDLKFVRISTAGSPNKNYAK